MPSSPTTNVESSTPIQQLNFYNKGLETSLFAWRGALTDKTKANVVLSNASIAMGLAHGILEGQKDNLNSPQAQLALRALRLAKRALEELNTQGFGSSEKVPVGKESLSASDLLGYFAQGGDLSYTNSMANASYQDLYFKHYFALLFSPAFKDYSQLDIIRLANTITDAAEQGSVTIKMPFKTKDEADKFIAFAKGGGIPFCHVSGNPQEAGFVEGGRQIALVSLIYDANYAAAVKAKGAAPAAPSTIREYTFARKATSEFVQLEGGVYGNSPTLQQMQQAHSSSEQAKKTAYTYFNELHYAEKFNEANIESKASAMNVFIDLVNDYMQYMGHSIDVYNPPTLQTFFNSETGKEFLAEFKKFYEAGALTGLASVEKESQLAQNKDLGVKRANLFQTVANDVLYKYNVGTACLLGAPASISGKAVSVWDNPNAVIKSWVDRLDKLEGSNMVNYSEYSQLARALLFGDYEKANELNSSLKAVNKAFLEAISGQKAALVKNADGTYSINNQALIEQLLARNDTALGLRFEGTLISEASKPRDRFGAFFVDALLEPDRRIEVTTGKLDTKLKVEVSETARTGSKVTAKVTVFVDIEGKDRQFLLNHAHTLDVLGKTADGTELKPVFTKDDGEQTLVNGKKATVFEVTFNTDKELYIMANAHKGDLESGWAWQRAQAKEAAVQISRITVGGEVAAQYPGTYMPLPFQAYSLTKVEAKAGEGGSITQQPINSMLCFGIRTSDKKLNFAPKYLIYPGEVDVKRAAPTYKLANAYVVVDRDLYYRGSNYRETAKYELYMKQANLEKMAKNGVVALFVKPASGDGVWVKLDGSLVDEKTLNALKELPSNHNATEVLYGPKNTFATKTAVSFLNNPNSTLRADASKAEEAPNTVSNALDSGGRYQSSHLPNAMVVESKSDLWLVRQHVIAKVEVDPNNPNKATVSQLDGQRIGTVDISTTAKPDLAGKTREEKMLLNAEWENTNALNMAAQIGSLAGGVFLFKPREDKDNFIYPTYIPRFDNIVKVTGYIYSMKDFFDSRGVGSGD
jgi:hypothetical protein